MNWYDRDARFTLADLNLGSEVAKIRHAIRQIENLVKISHYTEQHVEHIHV